MGNEGTDQPAGAHKLSWAVVVCRRHNGPFLALWMIYRGNMFIYTADFWSNLIFAWSISELIRLERIYFTIADKLIGWNKSRRFKVLCDMSVQSHFRTSDLLRTGTIVCQCYYDLSWVFRWSFTVRPTLLRPCRAGQLNYSHFLLDSQPCSTCAHAFACNWQLSFLYQRRG